MDPAVELSLVVPTYEEAGNIALLLRAVCAVLDGVLPGRHEVIVVDDDSRDGTAAIATALTAELPQIRVVVRHGERGLAAAVICGWQAARGTVLGTINADLQHPPEVLADMVRALPGTDLVVATRYAPGGSVADWHRTRRVASRGAMLLGTVLLPEVFGRVSDPLSGCYLVRRAAIAGIELRPLGYKTLMEILIRGRVTTIAEVPYHMCRRAHGASKAGPRQSLEYVAHLVRLRLAARGLDVRRGVHSTPRIS